MKFSTGKREALYTEGEMPKLYMHIKLFSIAQEEHCGVTRK